MLLDGRAEHMIRRMEPSAQRLSASVLSPLEQPVLRWMAARLPLWLTPDRLTIIGLIGSAVVFIAYVLSARKPVYLWVADLGLIVNWFGDSLDGAVARFRQIERPRYGFFIDHTTDILTQIMFTLGLGLSSCVRFEVACLALIVYLILSVFMFVKAQITGLVEVAFAGIGGTELRIGMIILNVSAFFVPPKPILLLWAPLTLADIVVLALTATVFICFLITFWREARRLAQEDPTPTVCQRW